MLPNGWDAIVIVPLGILYCVIIVRHLIGLTKAVQLQSYYLKSYLRWFLSQRRERYYSAGNLISVILLVCLWAASFHARDPYGYGAVVFLFFGLAANWLIAILSFIFLPPFRDNHQTLSLTARSTRLILTSLVVAAILSLSMFWVLLPISASVIVRAIGMYWILFGAALMLLIMPFVLVISVFVNSPIEWLLKSPTSTPD